MSKDKHYYIDENGKVVYDFLDVDTDKNGLTFGNGLEGILFDIRLKEEGKPFFMRNNNWYYFDDTQNKFVLTNNAPYEAIQSYKEFVGEENPYEFEQKKDKDNPYEVQEEEDKDNPYK